MCQETLGSRFDIHGGGLDLIFPHHENEIAQSECGNSTSFANYWMHNGLLTMSGGQKMGKSLGNVINVHVALDQFPSQALRLYYLQNHYRSSLPWNEEALPEALAMVARLYEARETAEGMGGEENPDSVAKSLGGDALEVLALGRSFEQDFHSAMDEDFNTGKAVGHLMRLARAINRLGNHKKSRKRGGPVVQAALQAFDLVASGTGLMTQDTAGFLEEVKEKRFAVLGVTREEIEQLLKDRATARAEKDWERADLIRGELEARQIMVMDAAEGVDWRVRLQAPKDEDDE